jgi:hypothetical protein
VSVIVAWREFTDRLLDRLKAEPQDRPLAGDFAAVCTDLARDTWELFPIALVTTDGQVVSLRDQGGRMLAFDSVSERDDAVVMSASRFSDLEAVGQLCWIPNDGLGALRMRLARLRAA